MHMQVVQDTLLPVPLATMAHLVQEIPLTAQEQTAQNIQLQELLITMLQQAQGIPLPEGLLTAQEQAAQDTRLRDLLTTMSQQAQGILLLEVPLTQTLMV